MRGEWYYADNGGPIGPITLDALVDHLRTSPNSGNVQVWRDGLEDWQAAKDLPELFDIFLPPPLPQEDEIAAAARSVPMGEAIGGKEKAPSRIAFFVALTVGVLLGLFGAVIYEISREGIGPLASRPTIPPSAPSQPQSSTHTRGLSSEPQPSLAATQAQGPDSARARSTRDDTQMVSPSSAEPRTEQPDPRLAAPSGNIATATETPTPLPSEPTRDSSHVAAAPSS